MIEKHARKDWSLPADRAKVPYSEFDGVLPPLAASNPLNPRPVLMETRQGAVVMVPTIPPVKIEPVSLAPVTIDQVPAVESSAYIAEYVGPVLPPKKVRTDTKKWWEYSSDEEEWKAGGYVNAEYHAKTRRFIPLPGSAPPIDRSTKRGVRKREKEAAAAEQRGQTSVSSEEENIVPPPPEFSDSAPPPPVREERPRIPDEPQGGWPLYLYGKNKMLNAHDKALRADFVARYGRLPPNRGGRTRSQEKARRDGLGVTSEGNAANRERVQKARRGASHSVQGTGGPQTPLGNIPIEILRSEISKRENAQKKAEEARGQGRRSRAEEEGAASTSTYTTQPYERPRFYGGKRSRRSRKGNPRARY